MGRDQAVVEQVRAVLNNETLRNEMAEYNYQQAAGGMIFSYRRATDELTALLAKPPLAPPTDD